MATGMGPWGTITGASAVTCQYPSRPVHSPVKVFGNWGAADTLVSSAAASVGFSPSAALAAHPESRLRARVAANTIDITFLNCFITRTFFLLDGSIITQFSGNVVTASLPFGYAGNFIRTVVPPPGTLSISMAAPWAFRISRTRLKPKPTPPWALLREGSAM